MTVEEFSNLANTKEYQTPLHANTDDLEEIYWNNITNIFPIYGADVCGSITDPECKEWNINHLDIIQFWIQCVKMVLRLRV